MPSGRRVAMIVNVNLDPVEGTFHTEEDAHSQIQRILDQTIPHYNPGVSALPAQPTPVVRDQETLPFGDWKMRNRKANWIRDDYYALPDLSQQPESD